MDLGVIDLRINPDAMPPLPLAGVNRRELRKKLVDALAQVGCTYKLLKQYDADYEVYWELPPTYTDTMDGKGLTITPPAHLKRRASELYKVYADCDALIIEKGLTTEALKPVIDFAGPLAGHPLVFSRVADIKRARALFAIEFVAFFKDIGAKAQASGDTIVLKAVRHWSVPVIGTKDGTFEGEKVDERVVSVDFYGSKGFIHFPTVDMYDHIHNWVSHNFNSFPNMDEVLRMLTLLKLTQEHGDYYEFDQALRNMVPFKGQPLTIKAELYTDAMFDTIREKWLEVDRDLKDRLKDLQRMLVPTFIDGEQFIKMFGIDPSADGVMNLKQEQKACRGMELFNKQFMETQTAIKQGKFVGIE